MAKGLVFLELHSPNMFGSDTEENNSNPVFMRVDDVVQIEPYFGLYPTYKMTYDPQQGRIITPTGDKILVDDGSVVTLKSNNGQGRVVFENPKKIMGMMQDVAQFT